MAVPRRHWEQVCSCKAKVLFDPFHAETLRLDHWLCKKTDADTDRGPERLLRHLQADLFSLPDDTTVTSRPNSVMLASTGATAALGHCVKPTSAWLQHFGPPTFCAPLQARAFFPARCCSTSTSRRERRACLGTKLGASGLPPSRECRHWSALLSLTD